MFKDLDKVELKDVPRWVGTYVRSTLKELLDGSAYRGRRGRRGAKGDGGDVGEVGPPGKDGATGARGLTGDTGPHGDDGDDGEVGKTGKRGVAGLIGRIGDQGPPGTKGDKGEQGDQGEVGPRPAHKWEGTRLSFELPNGGFGRSVNLQGPGGGRGAAGKSANQGYSDIALNGTNLEFTRDAAGPLGPDKIVDLSGLSGGGGGFAGLGIWRYRTDLTPNPSAGRLQFDTALIDNATELYVNEVNDGGTDMSVFLDLLVPGDIVYLQIQDDATQFVIIEIGVASKAADVYTFTILNIEGQGTTPTNNSTVAFVAGGPLDNFKTKDVTIASPIPTDNIRYFFTDRQITIRKLVYVLDGIVTSDATVFISFGPDRSVLGTELINAGTVVSDQTTGQVITSFDNATIPADSHIAIRVTAITDAPTELAATLKYS